MQPKTLHVFVSSTWKDLKPEREAVETALQRMRETKFLGMEYFGSRDEDTRRASLDEVDRCQIYIGIFGKRYGSGITEEEYRRAHEKGLKCFIYFKDESTIKPEELETDPENMVKLENLKKELRRLNSGHTIGPEFKNPDDLAAKITADLHRWIMDLFLYGISSLTTDYSVRIRNFITEYLGTPEQPVPFGGRDSDLRNLNTWLDDREASPYMLLAAPAGRGKSALLVNWSQQLLTKNDLAVVFIPVSIRFRTNLASVVFAASTARLAALHGENPPDPNASAEVLRGLTADYLSRPSTDGRQLLIILDGVDEAADWEAGPDLFLFDPPEGLRVIVSARYFAGDTDATNWLRRLGWDRSGLARAPELSPLTREGVSDVLQKMGVPLDRLSERVDIVDELHRLSEGDPLLVQLYVNDLWARRETAACLQPEDLQNLSPGLEGYFDRWWEDQRHLWGKDAPLREPGVRELLNLFACSLGPVGRDDIFHLASPEADLNNLTLDYALRPLSRFVIGDGDHQGYVFSHPRLGAYFYDKLSGRDRPSIESRFVVWGEDTLKALNEGKLPTDGASPYIVQYYGAHLERSGSDAETLLSLVSEGWLRAWEALEGAFSGFLNDVDRAWNAAEVADKKEIEAGNKPIYLGGEIRCALCFASVGSISANISPKLIFELIKCGMWTQVQGLAYIRRIPNFRQRISGLVLFWHHFSDTTESNILMDALCLAMKIEDRVLRIEALTEVAEHLKEPDRTRVLKDITTDLVEVKDDRLKANILTKMISITPENSDVLCLARKIRDEGRRAEILAELASRLDGSKKSAILGEAINACNLIKYSGKKAKIQARIACLRSDHEKIYYQEDAIVLARNIKDIEAETEALVDVARYLPEPKKTFILKESIAKARKMENKWRREYILSEIALLIQDPKESIAIARAIVVYKIRAETLAKVAPLLSDIGEAIAVANEIQDSRMRAYALTKIASRVSGNQKFEILKEAIALERRVEDYQNISIALAEIASKLPEPERTKFLEQALLIARCIKDDFAILKAVIRIGPLFSDPSDILSAINVIKRPRQRKAALSKIAVSIQNPQKALILANEIKDKEIKATTLAKIVPRLQEPQKTIILRESMDIANKIPDHRQRNKTVANIIPYLSDPQEAEKAISIYWDEKILASVLANITHRLSEPQKSLSMVRGMKNDKLKVKTLAKIASKLPEPTNKEIFKEALEITKKIDDDLDREFALAEIASHHNDPEEALALAKSMKFSIPSDHALVIIAPRLSNPQKALGVARNIKYIPLKAKTIAEVALNFPETKRMDLLIEALKMTWSYKHDQVFDERYMEDIGMNLRGLSIRSLYLILTETLKVSSRRNLDFLLINLIAMIHSIATICDSDSVIEIGHSISDMHLWWP